VGLTEGCKIACRTSWANPVPPVARTLGALLAGPGAEIVIRARVSAKVQGLGSVDLVGGTLDDIGRIGLRSIRPIPGTAGDKRSDGECKSDQANAASKRSRSGHGRVFLDRIGPVTAHITSIGRTMLLDRGFLCR
jgi:hypothetical protein